MTHEGSAYGLWALVIVNSAVFVLFAFSFLRPRTKRDWRTLSGFAAFVVAMFTEMYGFPLTVYLLSGWLVRRFPGLDPFSHDTGHLWYELLGLKDDPHSSPIHVASNVILFAGLWLMWASWRVLADAQRRGNLAVTGPYAAIRHPQYVALILVMLGFLVQWPTLPTLVMFPILVAVYHRLALREERDVRAEFGTAWDRYAAATSRFLPRLGRRSPPDLHDPIEP